MINLPTILDEVVDKLELPKLTAKATADIIFAEIRSALANGEEVSIHGFGTFKLMHTEAREGRNPQTREAVHIPAATRASFRAHGKLKAALNPQRKVGPDRGRTEAQRRQA